MLIDYIIKNNETVYSISKKTGIPYSTLNDLVIEKTDIKKCSADTLYRLAKYLNISMEKLYEGKDERGSLIRLYNEGTEIHLAIGNNNYYFAGPKNLVAFHRINKVEDHVAYVDTYYMSGEGKIYSEEEYVDLYDVLKDFGAEGILDKDYDVILKKPNCSSKDELIDTSIMVSDNFAIEIIPSTTRNHILKVTNLSRPSKLLQIQLEDETVIMSNMTKNMEKRAKDAVLRNKSIIEDEIVERGDLYA